MQACVSHEGRVVPASVRVADRRADSAEDLPHRDGVTPPVHPHRGRAGRASSGGRHRLDGHPTTARREDLRQDLRRRGCRRNPHRNRLSGAVPGEAHAAGTVVDRQGLEDHGWAPSCILGSVVRGLRAARLQQCASADPKPNPHIGRRCRRTNRALVFFRRGTPPVACPGSHAPSVAPDRWTPSTASAEAAARRGPGAVPCSRR